MGRTSQDPRDIRQRLQRAADCKLIDKALGIREFLPAWERDFINDSAHRVDPRTGTGRPLTTKERAKLVEIMEDRT